MDNLLDAPITPTPIKLNYTSLIVWFSLLTVGLFFRAMHWPFGSTFIVCSTAAITAFTFSKMIMITKFKNMLLVLFGSACLIWTLIFVWGAFFNDGYPYNIWGLLMYGIFFCIMFVIHTMINYSIRKKAR